MTQNPIKGDFFSNLAIILVVTALYVFTGYEGLYFATPPGYATAIWIPSGIALGAVLVWGLRILPGVFLGSLITNFYITIHFGDIPVILMPAVIGILIAIGATLQALAGWYIIKRSVGLHNSLIHPNDILLFSLVSGPLSCLVNATWSNTTLLILGVLPAKNYLLSWGTWWIGDSMGVLIFTPLFLILFAKPKSIWRQRILPILLPLCVGFAAIVATCIIVQSNEVSRIQSAFSQMVSNALLQLQNELMSKKVKQQMNSHQLYHYINYAFQNKEEYYSIKITDVSHPNNIQPIYTFTNYQLSAANKRYYIQFNKKITINNRQWVISTIPSIIYINAEFSWQLWSVLISGFLFCVLINIFLFIAYGQKYLSQIWMKEKNSALKNAESKNLLILNAAGEGIYGIDNDGCATFINPAAAKMLGFKESEFIGKYAHKLIHHSHVDGSVYTYKKCPIYAAIRHDKTQHITNEIFWRKDGSYFWVEYTSTPLKNNNQTNGAVVVFTDISERREIEFELQRMAKFDDLTSLPNRASFLEELTMVVNKVKKEPQIVAVAFIDIDNFKQINDNLGHSVGDKTLKIIADLLKSQLDNVGYLSRIGGDEFAVILEKVKSEDEIKAIFDRITDMLNTSIKIHEVEIKISLSIGVAVYPIAGKNAEELIMNADIAMYHAKESGKGIYIFYDEEISKRVKRRNQIDMQLRHALARNEFTLDYQMQVDIQTMECFGIESLLRWNNVELGQVAPSEFIPIAEANGLIQQIGEWVLTKSCLDYQKILSQFRKKDLILSINISVVQLENVNFLKMLEKILTETQMSNDHLLLEITETVLMHNPEYILKMMAQIKTMGIHFALDDFGVSYSSMQYLKKLPVSLIKIDHGFVREMEINSNDAKIVNAIIQLSHALGINTIAEGVENTKQFQILKEMGCEYMQGYYFAAPMTLTKLLQHPMLESDTVPGR